MDVNKLNIEFSVGDYLYDEENDQHWTIINIENRKLVMIMRSVKSFRLNVMPIDQMIVLLKSNKWSLEEKCGFVLPDRLNKHSKDMLERNKQIFNDVYASYGPNFIDLGRKTNRAELKRIADQYMLNVKSIKKIVLRYLQGGFQDYFLIDGRSLDKRVLSENSKKRGRKTKDNEGGILVDETVKKYFAEAMKEFENSEVSLKDAFETMLGNHYMTQTENGLVLMPYSQRPHWEQFRYYVRKANQEHIKKAKTGIEKWENDLRPLVGSSRSAVGGPGFLVECDEEEYPVYLVDREDRTKVIGKPVVYWGVDIYFDLILMFHVSFENNSYLGITNCLMSLKQNKNDLLASYGLPPVRDEVWPTNITPGNIRSDRGAEYLSKELDRICRELHINHQITPPRKGSAKGVVERTNAESVHELAPYLKNHGLVTNDYDDDAVKNAVFDLDQFIRMILIFIIKHNQQAITSRRFVYPAELVKDMKNGRLITRADLWNYGLNKFGPLKPLPHMDQFLWTLMVPDVATISREGITYHTLYYYAPDDEEIRRMQIDAGSKSRSINIRYDPRRVGTIYLNIDGKLHKASIDVNNPVLYEVAKLSRKAFDDLYIKNDALKRLKEEINIPLDQFSKKLYKDITKDAVSAHDEPGRLKSLRENSLMAKEELREQDAMAERFAETNSDDSSEELAVPDYSNETEEERMYRLARIMFDEED